MRNNMKTEHNPKFLTVEEAAQLVGVSHWTIRNWQSKAGKACLTRYKCGSNRTLVSRAELLEVVKAKEEEVAR